MKHPTFNQSCSHHHRWQKTSFCLHIYHIPAMYRLFLEKSGCYGISNEVKAISQTGDRSFGRRQLAVFSMFFVPPDADYLGYIDLRTPAILFPLMTTGGRLGGGKCFDRMGRRCWHGTGSTCSWCSFWSVVLREHGQYQRCFADLVPFTQGAERPCAGHLPGADHPGGEAQTIALTLAVVVLTLIGNHRTLPLRQSGMSMAEFLLMRSPTRIAFLAAVSVAGCGRGSMKQGIRHIGIFRAAEHHRRPKIILLMRRFAVCLPRSSGYCPTALPAAALVCTCADRPTSGQCDYPAADLVAFFFTIGTGAHPGLSGWLGASLSSPAGVGGSSASQVTSNVPLPCPRPGSRMKPPRLSSAHGIFGGLAPIASAGQPDLLPPDRAGAAGGKRPLLQAVHPVQPDFSGDPAG